MKRTIAKPFVAIIVAVVLAGCTALPSREERSKTRPDVVLKAGKVYEECLPLAAPQVIDYWFSASKSLEFNIHYHGDEAVYPVQSEAVTKWNGTFDPTCIRNYSSEQPPFFCLMWTNPHEEEVALNFEFSVRDKE
jgi:hypothetical protein